MKFSLKMCSDKFSLIKTCSAGEKVCLLFFFCWFYIFVFFQRNNNSFILRTVSVISLTSAGVYLHVYVYMYVYIYRPIQL